MSRQADRVRFPVHVTPNSHRTEIAGSVDGECRVRLRAPPVDGKANDALVRILAEALGLPHSAISIASGHTSRRKLVEVADAGLSRERIAAVLAASASIRS